MGLITLFYLDTAEFREEKDLNVDEIAFEIYLDQFGYRLKNKTSSMCWGLGYPIHHSRDLVFCSSFKISLISHPKLDSLGRSGVSNIISNNLEKFWDHIYDQAKEFLKTSSFGDQNRLTHFCLSPHFMAGSPAAEKFLNDLKKVKTDHIRV